MQSRISGSGFSSRRRLLSDSASFETIRAPNAKKLKTPPSSEGSRVCAKLVTTNRHGRREVINLSLDRPVVIGRNPNSCTYVVQDPVVSSVHCKLHAVISSTGGVLVSCQDMSTNGILLNGYKIRKTAAIVMDGDSFQITLSQTFKCVHILKEPRDKAHIFEPTPPQGGAYKNLRVGKYTVVSHCLGSGSFASVHLALDVGASRQVACKTVIVKGQSKENELQKVMKEVTILRGLQHPNINCVLDVTVDETKGWMHIFLELCTGGDLFSYITSRQDPAGRLCEGEAKYVMFQIIEGLKYLHDRMISHRGSELFNCHYVTYKLPLQPENILLFSPGPYPRVQIADFGLARSKAYQETLNVCGTVAYLPPEGILALDRKELGYVGMPADCWSAGVILYTILSGTHPFDYRLESQCGPDLEVGSVVSSSRRSHFSQSSVISEQVVKSRIVKGEIDFDDDVWDSMPDAKLLVGKLLIYNHTLRETVYGARRSLWISCDLEELQNAYCSRIGTL